MIIVGVRQRFGKKMFCFSIGIIYLFLLKATIFAQTPPDSLPAVKDSTAAGANAPIVAAENLIHIGDLIDVDVLGSTDYDWRGTLTPEGFLDKINFVEEPVYALCRTETEVAAEIAKGYGKFLNNPQVVVKIIDRSNRPVSTLYGAVKTPQRFQILRPVKLNELLILSGGITEKASGEVQLLRSRNLSCEAAAKPKSETAQNAEKIVSGRQIGGTETLKIQIGDLIKGKPESNPYVLSGDVITVEEAEPVYVIGGVANPKRIGIHGRLTVARAVDAAGGVTRYADPKKVTIFRRENGDTKILEVDLEKIKNGQSADVELQSLDVVEVAQRGGGKSKFPPVIKNSEDTDKKNSNLSLRVID